ncbi:MAG: hypothetical protein KAT65_25935, partial [Methanophagales archaeon]|nr:hypothetical protein [Methanophagales archaeon]
RVVTVPKLSITKLPEVTARKYLDNEVSSQVVSKIKEIISSAEKVDVTIGSADDTEATGAEHDISFGVFEEIKKDEEIWITDAGLVSQSPNILVVTGVEGMGFEVIKGLLRLELEDRGHEPNFKPIKVQEEDKEEIKEISEIDDKTAYNRLISLEGSFDDWIKLKNKEGSISEELKKALSKTTLRYLVFENKLPLSWKSRFPKANFEIVKERKEESIKAIKSLGIPLKEINLVFYSPESEDLRELDIPIANHEILLEFAKIFAKILQIKKSDKEMKNTVRNNRKMDTFWYELFDKRDSAIEFLLREYNKPDSKVREILRFPADKLPNESKEHFVIKQLVIKNLLKRKIGGEKITPEKKEDEGADQRWEKIDFDGIKCTKEIEIEIEREVVNEKGEVVKRPDIKVEDQGKNIWVEVETCKTLDDPLEFVYEKLAKIPDISPNDPEAPDELWIIFPYRKYFLYGAKQIEDKIRSFFMEWFKKTKKFKPRIFFADLYNEKLVELRWMGSD